MSTLPILTRKYQSPYEPLRPNRRNRLTDRIMISDGHLLPDKASQELALGIMLEAQRNCAAVTCPGTEGRLREAWGWRDEGGG